MRPQYDNQTGSLLHGTYTTKYKAIYGSDARLKISHDGQLLIDGRFYGCLGDEYNYCHYTEIIDGSLEYRPPSIQSAMITLSALATCSIPKRFRDLFVYPLYKVREVFREGYCVDKGVHVYGFELNDVDEERRTERFGISKINEYIIEFLQHSVMMAEVKSAFRKAVVAQNSRKRTAS